jgi:hypothetical protein
MATHSVSSAPINSAQPAFSVPERSEYGMKRNATAVPAIMNVHAYSHRIERRVDHFIR